MKIKLYPIASLIVLCYVLLNISDLKAQYYRYPSDTNFNDIVNSFYWNYDGFSDTLEGSEFRKFQKWENYWGPRLSPSGSFQIAANHIKNYVDNYDPNDRESEIVTANWVEMGPKTNGIKGVGLVNDIEFHPIDPNILFCGTSGGGVWKTINNGQDWFNLNTDVQLARLGVSTIAVDTTDPNIIYIGTGDVDYEFCYSDGIYRTMDGGINWEPINDGFLSSIDGLFLVSKILVDPDNQNEMYVSGTFGIYKCNNRKAPNPDWYKVYPTDLNENQNIRNIHFKPGDNNTLYGVGIDIIRSESGGENGTWYSIATDATNLDLTNTPWPNAFANSDYPYLQIMNMAVGPSNKYLYVSCIAFATGPPHDFKSDWTNHLFRFDVELGQWTDLNILHQLPMIWPGKHELAVSPDDNDSKVYGGGVTAFKSTTAGNYWSGFYTGAHVDYHSIEFSPFNSQLLYFCTDGGIWMKNLGTGQINELNESLGVATIYYYGSSDLDPNQVLSGMQDCGLNYYKQGSWSHEKTSDGFECVLDYNNINIMYGTIYSGGNGSIYRSMNSANNPNFTTKINNTTETSFFGAPLLMSSNDPKILVQGRRDVWKVNDATAVPPPNNDWYKVSDFDTLVKLTFPLEDWFHVTRSIDHCIVDENYIYASVLNAAHIDQNVLKNDCIIVRATNGGGTGLDDWEIITPPGTRYYVRDLAVSSNNPDHIWLAYSSYEASVKVKKSVDGGITWEDYGEGLPDLPINCIIHEFGSNDALYIGSDVGVYYRDDTLSQWEPFMDGLPNVVVNWLEINYTANKLRAGTFGRGLWESDISCTGSNHQIIVDFDQFWNRNFKLSCQLLIKSNHTLTITGILNCTSNSKILIEPGGKLIIDGGVLINTCGDMWQGIQVWGNPNVAQSTPGVQGKLTIINGGVIESAITAVTLGKEENGQYIEGFEGGILQADEAHFINNRTAVRFYPYRNQTPGGEVDNLSYFHNSEFLTDAELADESLPEKFIYVEGVSGIGIKGCTFMNTREEEEAPIKDRGTGIYSEDANFTVSEYCIGGYPCENPVKSVFHNLNYGIKAYDLESTKTFQVDNSEFYENLTGIYAKGIEYATVIFNDIELRNVNIFHTSSDIFGGLFLDHCTGYTVEENYFYNDYPYDPVGEIRSIGITVDNSGDDLNMIYRNSFDKLHMGILAQNDNRGNSEMSGLKLECNQLTNNEGDIAITADVPSSTVGVSHHQGAYIPGDVTAPAGNVFSHKENNDPYSDLNNTIDQAHIYYFHHVGTPTDSWVPLYYSNWSITAVSYNNYSTFEEACPSNFSLGGGGSTKSASIVMTESDLRSRMTFMENLRDSADNVLNLWIDGGNTPQVDFDVAMSIPPEAIDIYDELMSDSPYLSDTVLNTSIDKEDVLVNAMIRDIMVANPQTAKNEEILQELDQRVPPLPDYMMAEIMEGENSVSVREQLEAEIAWYKQERGWAYNKLVNMYLTDTTITGRQDSLVSLFNNHGSLHHKYYLINKYFDLGDTNNALLLLSDLPNQYVMTPNELSIHQDYTSIFNIISGMMQQNLPLDSLDSASKQILYQIASNNSRPGIMAQNIMQHIDTANYPEQYILPVSGAVFREYYTENPTVLSNSEQNKRFSVYPNPCKDYFIIEYNFETIPQHAYFTVTDQMGRVINEGPLIGLQNQIIIRTSAYGSGLHTIRLFVNGNTEASLKLNILQ